METDHSKPHHILLLFEQAKRLNDSKQLAAHNQYYKILKEQGKAIMSGDFWNLSRSFVIVQVTCDSEFEEIIDNDPGLMNGHLKLTRAMPFAHDEY